MLHAFKTYLRRNKILSEEAGLPYQNFIVMLTNIYRCPPNKRSSLREKIEQTHPLAEKNWLLQQIELRR